MLNVGKLGKRALATLSAFLLLGQTLLLPQNAQAAEAVIQVEDFVYDQNSKTIVAYLGKADKLTVPAQLTDKEGHTYPVEAIGNNAFSGEKLKSALTSLTLPEGLKTIGANAFAANKITSLTVPASVTEIGAQAFINNGIGNLTFAAGSNLSNIQSGAFMHNSIGNMALQSLNKLQNIGADAFRDNRLSELTLPASVTSVGSGAFNANGRYVYLQGGSATIKTDVKMGEFGAIYHPVSIFVKGIDADSQKQVYSLNEIKNDPYTEKPLEQLLFEGNVINLPAPAISKYSAPNISLTIDKTNTKDNPFVVQYKTSTQKPVISGLTPISVPLKAPVDLKKDVKATDAAGNDITARLKITPPTIDTSVKAEHKVTYSVTDDAGNTATETRQVLVGIDLMKLETGKGWLNEDFTFSGASVTGLSDKGKEKIKTNPDVVLPSFNPTNDKREKITTLADSALQGVKLASIVFPESLQHIGDSALAGNNLTEVKLPEKLASLGRGAFEDNKLISVNLPATLKEIPERAFKNNKITTLNIPDTVTSVGQEAFMTNKIGSLNLGSGVQTIADRAFAENSLEQIKFPASLTSVGREAFKSNQLTFVEVPENVKTLGVGVFRDNRLTSFKLPEHMDSIPDYAFYNNKIKELPIAHSVKNIGEYAFAQNLIQELDIPANVENIKNSAFTENYNLKKITLHEGLKTIGDYAFRSTALDMDELTIPNGVQKIGNYAFNGDGGAVALRIKKLVLPDSLQELGEYAFTDVFLEDLTLPKNLTYIPQFAFADNNLAEVKIPAAVTEIRRNAFSNNRLTAVTLFDNLKTIGESAFYKNALTNVKLPATLTSIGDYAFQENQLESLQLPEGLTALGEYSFYRNRLERVKLPQAIKVVPRYAFSENRITSYELAPGTTEIRDGAFKTNKLVNAVIPPTVTTIGEEAFRYNSINEVKLPQSVTQIGKGVFASNTISQVELSPNLESIPYEAFAYNNLSAVEIPDKVKEIGSESFRNNSLTAVKFKPTATLTTIGDSAFQSNGLTDLTVPSTVNSIGSTAFLDNPGNTEDAQHRVLLLAKDANSKIAAVNVQDGTTFIINKVWVTINKKLEGTNKSVALPERQLATMNRTFSYTPKDSFGYEPVDKQAKQLEVKEQDTEMDVFYKQKANYDPTAVIVDLVHAVNGNEDEAKPYGLKEYARTQNMPLLLKIKGSGNTNVNIPDTWVNIDLRQEVANGHIKDVMFSSNVSDSFTEHKFEDGIVKLKLKNPISGLTAINMPFYLQFEPGTPNNFVLDLTGKTYIVQNELIVATSQTTHPIGLRARQNSNRNITKQMNGESYGKDTHQGEPDGTGYMKRGTEAPIEYSFSYYQAYNYNSEDYADIREFTITDTLPTYEGKDANGQVKSDLKAHFDPKLNPDWQLNGDKLTLKQQVSPRKFDTIPSFKLYLSYPGIKSGASVVNNVEIKSNGDSKHTLNGTLEEAEKKLVGEQTKFEPEEEIACNDDVSGNIIAGPETPTPIDPKKPQDTHGNGIHILKRCLATAGDSSLNILSLPEGPRHATYNYRNSERDWYSPERSISKYTNSHYENVFYDSEADRHKEFIWAVQVQADACNLHNPVINDYGLDARMRYSGIQIPAEFKQAKLTLYSEDNNGGDKLFEGTIYGDRFDFSPELSAKTRSLKLELIGRIENNNPQGQSSFAFPIYTRLREPDKSQFDSKDTDSDGRSDKNTFYSKVAVNSMTYTNTDPQEKELTAADESERICILPWEERVNLIKTLENQDKQRDRNETLHYQLILVTVKPQERTLQKFKALDLLPPYVNPLQVEFTRNFRTRAVNPTYRIEENFENTGRKAIIIEADSYNPGGKDMEEQRTPFVDITAVTTTDLVTKDDGYVNDAYLTAQGSSVWETGDNPTNFKYFADAKRVLQANAKFPVLLGSELRGYKYIKSDTDLSWNPLAATLKSEQKFQYRLQILNPVDSSAPGVEIYDVLPYNDDTRIVKNSKDEYVPRGTLLSGIDRQGQRQTGRMKLTGPITFDPTHADDYDVYYTTTDVKNLKSQDPFTVVSNQALWQTAAQLGGDYSKVTAFRICSKPGKAIEAHTERNFYVPMQAPLNKDYVFDNQHAVNTYSYHAVGSNVFVEGNAVSATMESPRGLIRLCKKSVNDMHNADPTAKNALAGVTFKLWKTAINNVDPADKIKTLDGLQVYNEPVSYMINGVAQTEMKTDENGNIVFDNLALNRDYILEETSTTPDHVIDKKFTLVKGEDIAKGENNLIEVEVDNRKINRQELLTQLTGSIEFYKVDADGEPLPYTTFEVTGGPAGKYQVKVRASSSETGLVRFSNLPLFGDKYPYTLKEIAPRNSLQPIQDQEIRFTNNGSKEQKVDLGTIKNDKAVLHVYKLALFNLKEQEKSKQALESLTLTSGKHLQGVKLQLQDEQGTIVDEQTSNAEGQVTFKDLQVDKDYYLAEPQTPQSYSPYVNAATQNRIPVRVNARGVISVANRTSNNNYVVFPNYPEHNTNRIDLLKTDEADNPLSDTEFSLYEIGANNSETLVAKKTTNAEGKLSFEDFAVTKTGDQVQSSAKTFEVRETAGKIGYLNNFKPFRFTTQADDLTYLSLKVVNPKVQLHLQKTEEDGVTPVSKAQFSLYENAQAEGTPLETATSDEQGQVNFQYAAFDTSKQYSVKETQVPAGYSEITPDKVQVIDLPGLSNQPAFNGQLNYTWKNRKIAGSIKVVKQTENGNPLAGVKFTLTLKDTDQVQTAVTDDFGQLQFSNLAIGSTYVLNEVETNKGYVIDEKAKNVEIKITDNKEQTYTFTNKLQTGTFSLHKQDEQGNALQDVEFTLKKQLIGPLYLPHATAKTDAQGNIAFTDLPVGVYKLTETDNSKAKINGKSVQENGAWFGLEPEKTVWLVTVAKDDNSADGSPKITVQEENKQEVLAQPLQVVNSRIEPAKVQLTVNKAFVGGSKLTPLPTFKVKLIRKNAAGVVDNTVNAVAELQQVPQADALTLRAQFNDLDYDYYDQTTHSWQKWQYTVSEQMEGENTALFTPTVSETTIAEPVAAAAGNNNDVPVIAGTINVTNTYTPAKNKTVKAVKKWVGGSSVHPTVHFKLYRQAGTGELEEVPTAEAPIKELANGVAEVEWQNLTLTDQDGNPYTFSVKEVDAQGKDYEPENYKKTENALEVTNTYVAPTDGAAKATKTWVNGPADRPTIYLKLYRQIEGKDVEAVPEQEAPIKELKSGTTEVLWNKLTKTDAAANPYTFSVKEVDAQGNDFVPENYQKKEEGLTVTNTYIPPKNAKAKAKKVWVGQKDKLPTIWFKLYRQVEGGAAEAVPEQEAAIKELKDGLTEVEWQQLTATDLQGRPYIFSVKETDKDGKDFTPKKFKKEEKGLQITNRKLSENYRPFIKIDKHSISRSEQVRRQNGEHQSNKPVVTKTGETKVINGLLPLVLIALLTLRYRKRKRN